MHILITLITAAAGLIWALNSLQRAGVNLNALNPFFWYRRHQWAKKVGEGPQYTLDKPLDAAALVLLGTAKIEGEISREQKHAIINIFTKEFHLGTNAAKALFASSSYLLQHENDLQKNVKKIMKRSAEQFSETQITSLIELMKMVSNMESPSSDQQNQLMLSVSEVLSASKQPARTWD